MEKNSQPDIRADTRSSLELDNSLKDRSLDEEKAMANAINAIEDEEVPDYLKKSRGVILIESVKDFMYTAGNEKYKYGVFAIIYLLAWSAGFDKSTTRNYEPNATSSYGNHTLISTLAIATNIVNAVGDLFFAKFSDLTSRPLVYFIGVAIFILGYVTIPTGNTIASFVVGSTFGKLGSSTLGTINNFLMGDLTPMKWRGFALASLSSPHIVIPFISGFIVEDINKTNWRWGYGMFAITIPCTFIPCAILLFYVQKKASKVGIVQEKSERYGITVSQSSKGWFSTFISFLIEMDLFGLLLLGFGVALVLLPLSLYKSANDGFKNPSLIAMFIVGGVLVAAFALFEVYVAPYPCLHKSTFNRTIITEIIFNVVYFMAGSMRDTYLSSFTWVYKPWSDRDWTYFNSTGTVSKSIFGLVAGLLHRRFHRYKYVQIAGICVEIVASGLWLTIKGRDGSTATMVMAEILSGLGGGIAIYSSRTAVQIAVPHQNMAMAISTLFLFTSIGRSIGSAVAAAVWNGHMPNNLRKYMPAEVTDAEVRDYFKDLRGLRKLSITDPIRLAAMDAYVDTYWYLWRASLGILFICFIVCFFQKNYYLGDGQNAIEADGARDQEPDFFERTVARIPFLNRNKSK